MLRLLPEILPVELVLPSIAYKMTVTCVTSCSETLSYDLISSALMSPGKVGVGRSSHLIVSKAQAVFLLPAMRNETAEPT